MIYFKSPTTSEVFAYETKAERETFGASDLVEMTQQEVDQHINRPATPLPIAEQIENLERQSGMVKAVRKFMLTAMESEAVKQGAAQGLTAAQSLALLAAKNSGYAAVKALDNQIEALEAQL